MQNIQDGFPWPHIQCEKFTYKKIDNVELSIKVYTPEDHNLNKKTGAVVFFFGGGWVEGTIDHFQNQCRYLSSLGIVSFTPEYRVKSRYGTTPFECVEDGKDALNWIYDRVDEFGIDRNRIALGGGSAGGHVALASVLIPSGRVELKPRAFILFNPVVDTTSRGYGALYFRGKERDLSPIHHLKSNIADMIIFHGTEDVTVPLKNVIRFRGELQKLGNSCELVPYSDVGHGFFNYGKIKDGEWYFFDTLKQTENFLRKTEIITQSVT